MKIHTLVLGMVQTNVYVLIQEESREAVLFDPGDVPERICDYLNQNQLEAKAVCLTHGHFDHILAVPELQKKLSVPVYASAREENLLSSGELNESLAACRREVTVKPDRMLKDGEVFEAAGFQIMMIDTPGHTEGSCCYYLKEEKVLFSGDTLFEGSVGRTDLHTGSMNELMRSIKEKLSPLPDDTEVYPGHGGMTTIGDERKWNPFWRE